ncbi:MAG: P-II family nitrogen regulator [Bacteroidetes bacterium]|nr:P-II family nitrogen regulator [Bacteroidota bacterium]
MDGIFETIRREAHTDLRGEGKIYVLPVEDAGRISTGERGEAAA